MVACGPRIDRRLLEDLVRIDDGLLSIAEICRRVGASADARGLTRPSYESVRLLVRVARAARSRRESSHAAEIWEQTMARSAYWRAFGELVRLVARAD